MHTTSKLRRADSARGDRTMDVSGTVRFRPRAADIFVNFRTSFYDEDHQIVLSKAMVAQRYWEGWFAWDLLATLPYHLVATVALIAQPGAQRMLAVGICKVPIGMRLFRLTHKLDELSSVGFFRVVLQVVPRPPDRLPDPALASATAAPADVRLHYGRPLGGVPLVDDW